MNFDKFQPATRKPNERNQWLYDTAEKLNRPIGQVGSLVKGWNTEGIRSMYLASESLAKETGKPFSMFWFWQMKEIRKQLVDNFS